MSKSGRVLHPLEDPIDLKFDLHRWLSHEREEAYSDWLAWVLAQFDTECVLNVLHACPAGTAAKYRNVPVQIDREVGIRDGRLDITVRAKNRLLLILEVKRIAADDADTEKQSGYTKHARAENAAFASLLLVTDAVKPEYEGFLPLKWSTLCIAFRRLLPQLRFRLGLVRTAMIAAFIGAVERNILQLIGPGEGHHGKALLYGRTADHVAESLIQ